MNQSQDNKIPVSIIIPVYNVEEWIDECLTSVVNQTFPYFEVLLMSDGAADGSDEGCAKWVGKDERIHLYCRKNEGPAKARNMGIQKSQGTYLVFLDADDWIDYQYLEKMYHRIVMTKADMVE